MIFKNIFNKKNRNCGGIISQINYIDIYSIFFTYIYIVYIINNSAT